MERDGGMRAACGVEAGSIMNTEQTKVKDIPITIGIRNELEKVVS